MDSESYLEVSSCFSLLFIISASALPHVSQTQVLCLVQKLSALSASLARVVSAAEEEEAEMDHFPAEGVRAGG